MPEPAVLASYVATYGALITYAAWMHLRHRRTARKE